MSDETMQVFYVNGEGAGFADVVDVPKGTTVGSFFKQQMGGSPEDQYTIKVNRDITPSDYVLHEGDKVTITPAKVGGSH